MTKLLKKVAISVCALLAFCCLAVGCDIIDYDPMSANSVNYTVQVSAEDNTSVKGIDVVFNKDGETVATYILDETGVVVADLPAAEYTVTLGNLPEGYALSAEKVTPADRSLIALVVVKANYSVIVHADDDIAFDGMKVSFYTEEALNEFELDSTGKVEVKEDGTKVEGACQNYTANAEGKCSFQPANATDEYHLKAVKGGYVCENEYYTEGVTATFRFVLKAAE